MAQCIFKDGRAVIFDDEDAHLVAQTSWCPSLPINVSGHCYATGWIPSLQRRDYMHRLIAGAGRGQVVDHINGNTLDNTRANLRLCTPAQNNGNARWPVGPTGYRGVVLDKRRGTYFARIAIGSREKYLGARRDPAEAARLYDAAALAHFGEFATLNFPREAA